MHRCSFTISARHLYIGDKCRPTNINHKSYFRILNRLTHSNNRRPLAGLLILAMVLVTVGGALFGLFAPSQFLWIAGLASWAAALLLICDVSRAQQIQVSVLVIVGALLMIYAIKKGVSVDFFKVITSNTGLLSMITAVGFLRLVAIPKSAESAELPVGRQAYLKTLLGTSLFGSVINISAPMLIADRIHRHRPLQRLTAQSITRVFSACAAWSPFFAGMAVVLTYVNDAQILWIIAAGLPFAIVGLLVVYSEAIIHYSKDVKDFLGYPMQIANLWIPALLAISVVLGTWLLPKLSILVVIASSALLLTATTLLIRTGFSSASKQLYDHVVNALPHTVNELVLFLAAGVLATGISAIVQSGMLVLPITHFDATMAIQLLGIIILIAAMGVHPVILISSLTPLLLSLNPNPNLLALTYLFAWSLGTCGSPLSGTHLVFQGRYGIPSWKAAIWNWPYVAVMYLLSSAWLYFIGNKFA